LKEETEMKKFILALIVCLLSSPVAYSETQNDGFDITILHSATKSFKVGDVRIDNFIKYLQSNFDKNSSGSWSSNDVENEETVFLDKKGNSIKVATEKNTKTGVGTTTITIIGPEDFVASLRTMLK
jgi:hypothetical protein